LKNCQIIHIFGAYLKIAGGIVMLMGWIWTGFLVISTISAAILDRGALLAAAVLEGAQKAVELTMGMAGALCLWSGVGAVMEQAGLTQMLSRLLSPLLHRLFPETKKDPALAGFLSANICANFLGLGNAATPMGIQAAKRLSRSSRTASNELCRLIVLNTASIQLIPANVAAIRSQLGCATPFDILPSVWITSSCSACMGLLAAYMLGRIWK
jgi:spore maturation protein A